ncbi:MAG TPA: mannonate dehydratase [Thermomicrobiales bacterium]|nr:mannonate dehydratase [Thermomicrobiales bacterium]
MQVLLRERDLSDEYLRFAAQVGADGLDFHNERSLPGVAERGYVDERGMRALLARLRRWGLGVHRVTPPRPYRFLRGEAGGDEDADTLCRTVEALGKAGVPFMSMPVHLRQNAGFRGVARRMHRGGYRMNGFTEAAMRQSIAERPLEWTAAVLDDYFERCVRLYERVVPIAETYDLRLVLHPSDPPLPDAEFSPRRWSRILDAVPSAHSGLLYCVGTRYEAGVDIHDDIRAFGRRGTIFHVHFRNVRGQIPTTGGYEEVALHDGDMNMFRVLQSLKAVGYDGGLQTDHLPVYDGDENSLMASAYAVGYIKALLAALET